MTVISESSTYCYSGMAPGVLGGEYQGTDITIDIEAVVSGYGIRFIPQKVTHIDPIRRVLTLGDRTEVSYDIVSFNIGSIIPVDGLSLDSSRVLLAKPILNFLPMRSRVEALLGEHPAARVVVAGGGPASLEIASNLCRLAELNRRTLDVTIVSSGPLMPSLPRGARRSVLRNLKESGVRVMDQCRLHAVDDRRVRIQGGPDLEADLVVLAVGVRPQSLFNDSGLPTGVDGGLLVNRCLQSSVYPEIFGGGDCVTPEVGRFPRIGVVACRQNPVITRNIMAALENRSLSKFRLRRTYLQIFNLGRKRALMVMGRIWFSGRMAFRIKDAIDTRFIHRLRRSLSSVR